MDDNKDDLDMMETDLVEADYDDSDMREESPVAEHTPSPPPQTNDAPKQMPAKIRKKPGRKPNPASPALRKAQNRAAQRAFRERKERHLKELESAIKQVREQRDRFSTENEQLKSENDILRSENWYLKGIVLSLQLVCFKHNLVIPEHSPYINDHALSILAQSIPEPISTYLDVNSKSKLPTFNKSTQRRHQRDRYVTSGSIVITEDGIQPAPPRPKHRNNPNEHTSQPFSSPGDWRPDARRGFSEDQSNRISLANLPDLTPVEEDHHPQLDEPAAPRPVMLTDEPLTSNLAAIQTLRLRLRLQAACVRMNSLPFSIQPTLLQLTIPHDPRIDLVPTSHMRDRMILFRDQFNLDDCFRCLLSGSVFHGGDPVCASNWQLPREFFEKFWFLTNDFSLRRITNRWRRMQGLKELEFNPGMDALPSQFQQQQQQQQQQQGPLSASPLDLQQTLSQPPLQQPRTPNYATGASPEALPNQPPLEAVGSSPSPRPWSAGHDSPVSISDISSFFQFEVNRNGGSQPASAAPSPGNASTGQRSPGLSQPSKTQPAPPPATTINPSIQLSYPPSLSSTCSSSHDTDSIKKQSSEQQQKMATDDTDEGMFSSAPIRLTSGYCSPQYYRNKQQQPRPPSEQHPPWYPFTNS